ncbi:SDR family NAD(P)-dependent oxidoreductase [Acidaminobacter sp. JC074]|uniref:SDR family NAD(P)-dependent oxidoreductase n=1 Tax=Acidaminobacter sp. JC074 TaxID=2530199 RepID=UPI001F106DA8|nr:SDR family NAD(P)-dependent oxidoreductase [Acidaminobacter sp. JC074]MCH4889693.1 SDR family NAD(P)-dependent oxidoreductase [Acidaminobacter sp. JC074]
MKTALITGATDGIGRSTAISLAKKGYQIHVLGLGKEKGQEVIATLNKINPKGNHELFIVDLSTLEGNRKFLDTYKENYKGLDLLILNANAMFKKPRLSKDGMDMGFTIGFFSRYMFSVMLDDLLKERSGRVLHIGGATLIKPIKFDKLKSPDYKGSDTTYMGFMANNLMVNYVNQDKLTDIPYEYMEPGIVNTNTVKSQNVMVRLISKMMGMIEPEESGERIASYIINSQASPGSFYILGKKKEPKDKVKNGRTVYKKLMTYAYDFTGLKF